MPVALSIKNVPDVMVRALKRRAKMNHRSLQGELLSILEEAAGAARVLTPRAVLAKVESLGLRTRREAASIIRKDRDAR